ncbi:MAG TPA: tetratricopeptide repeat protein [Thermoanaerobaculia bacterium]|nr:tetratricopeptide repeat protein [Thermoanaerobaculia bacterium]
MSAFKREQVVRTAEKYVGKGKIEAAIKEYRKVLADNPKDVNTLNRLGDLYARSSRVEEAIRLFTQIAERYTEDGFLVKAIAIYKKIIKLDPTRLAVYEKLAELYHRQGLVNEARTQYQVLADYYLKHNDAAAAINIYLKMAEVEPDNPSHHLKLAELYQQGKLWDKAMRSYRVIAELMLQHERVEEAVRVYERAFEVHPEDLGFLTDAVLGLRDGGHTLQATRLLDRAMEITPQAEKVARLVRGGERRADSAGHEAVSPPVAPPSRPALGPPPPLEADQYEGEDEDVFFLDLEGEGAASLATPPIDRDRAGATSASAEAFEEPEAAGEQLEEMGLEGVEIDFEPGPPPVEPSPVGGEGEELGLRQPERAADAAAADEEAIALEGSFELELEPPEEIDWSFDEAIPQAPAPPSAEEARGQATDSVPAVAEAPAAPADEAPRPQDLVAEAEVFAKYGLEEKARERVEQVLAVEPQHLDALQLLVDLQLRKGGGAAVDAAARRLRRAAEAADREEIWERARQKLERAGFQMDVKGAAAPRVRKQRDRVSQLLESLLDEAPPARRETRDRRIDDALAEIASDVLERPRRRPPAPPPVAPTVEPQEPPREEAATPAPPPAAVQPPAVQPPAEAAPPSAPRRWEEEFDEELPDIVLPEERRPDAAEALDDSGMDWLDATGGQGARDSEEKLFDDEEEFFDLAAELEEELDHAEKLTAEALGGQQEEPSLEEIVEGFKRGVAENLSAEDYATHYNLGIAYREMGLLDEAIGEFQLAAKAPEHLVECCSMLGVCFLEKGLPELAVKWYQRGLAASNLKEETVLSLLYDMGNSYLAMGDPAAARKTFVELYGINSHYRDVVAKLEELGR